MDVCGCGRPEKHGVLVWVRARMCVRVGICVCTCHTKTCIVMLVLSVNYIHYRNRHGNHNTPQGYIVPLTPSVSLFVRQIPKIKRILAYKKRDCDPVGETKSLPLFTHGKVNASDDMKHFTAK